GWYIHKHGRIPPPNFDKWYAYAKDRNVLDLTDFDQIYHDLRPFWGLPAAELRATVANLYNESGVSVIKIASHEAAMEGYGNAHPVTHWRAHTFIESISSFIKHLPDMEIILNLSDEPRVIVPFDAIERLNDVEYNSRAIAKNPSNDFHTTSNPPSDDENNKKAIIWMRDGGDPLFEVMLTACPPSSPVFDEEYAPSGKYLTAKGGFVYNFNLSSDICTIGYLAKRLNGYLIAPSSTAVSQNLIPIFSECKLSVNNDILYPANMYFTDDERYTYKPEYDTKFEHKKDQAIWRGVPSEGLGNADNWNRFQRHRLINLFNSSHVSENGLSMYSYICNSSNDELCYPEDPRQYLNEHSDIGFTEIGWCPPEDETCIEKQYNQFEMKNQTTFAETFAYKYLFDVDGKTFSGRFIPFLQSLSLAFKSTIFREWHDSRLIPWANFVPFDIEFKEAFASLVYFTGYGDSAPARTALAKKIGENSQNWVNKAIRRDDMNAYKFLLLLEYARILDDDRDAIGF
ncbi:glycosyltransferase family 90 protein, partial [Tortispora caseinolytica NRRL Y-17796]